MAFAKVKGALVESGGLPVPSQSQPEAWERAVTRGTAQEEDDGVATADRDGGADARYSGGMGTVAAPDSMRFLSCQML